MTRVFGSYASRSDAIGILRQGPIAATGVAPLRVAATKKTRDAESARIRLSYRSAAHQWICKIAVGVALTSTALTAQAEPPRPTAGSRSDAPTSKGAASGRSKPTTPPAPPALETAPLRDAEGTEGEAKVRAQTIFEQGVVAYKEGRFFDAVEMFLETNRIYPDPKLCFNIARAYEGLGNVAGALRYYREYLRRTPSASDRADVETSIRQLELALSQKGLQQLSVFSTPEAATVSIDGRPVGLTPWTGETWPGKHRVTLSRIAYIDAQQIVELAPHRASDIQIEMQAEPPPRPTPLPDCVRREPARKIELLTVATLAAGAILLGSAVTVGLSSSDSTRTTAFLGGAGLGVTAVGGVLFYFDLSGGRSGVAANAASSPY